MTSIDVSADKKNSEVWYVGIRASARLLSQEVDVGDRLKSVSSPPADAIVHMPLPAL